MLSIDEVNMELAELARMAKQEIVDFQYEEMMDELAEMIARYTLTDDCDGPWYWELK